MKWRFATGVFYIDVSLAGEKKLETHPLLRWVAGLHREYRCHLDMSLFGRAVQGRSSIDIKGVDIGVIVQKHLQSFCTTSRARLLSYLDDSQVTAESGLV